MGMEQVWKGDIVHNQMALFFIHLQKEGMIGDDVPVMKVLDVCEVAL